MRLRLVGTTVAVSALLMTGVGCGLVDGVKNVASSAADKAEQKVDEKLDAVLLADGPHVVLVPGYGAPVEGSATYQEYVQTVAEFVEDESNGVDAVVFSGGYSTLADLSEAEAMNRYFNRVSQLDALLTRGVRVYKEECAIVSWQNIAYTHELLKADNITPSKVTIFGDINRKEKLLAFGSVTFNQDLNIESGLADIAGGGVPLTAVEFIPFGFGGADPDIAERNAKFAAEIAGAYDPAIGNEILQKRITEWSGEFDYDVANNLVAKGCTQFAGFE